MVSGDTLKIRDVCMDFEAYFKVHNLVSGSIMIFHVVVSVYRLVKIWNSLQFPDELGQVTLIFSGGICNGSTGQLDFKILFTTPL